MRIELTKNVDANDSGRTSTRVPSELKYVTLILDSTHSISGEVIDESFGGIGLRFELSPELIVDQEVEVSYDGVETSAVVRHSGSDGKGGHRIGLQWKAQMLAREARDLQQMWATHSGDKKMDSFVQMLPGGVFMMWKFFEAGKSWNLLETTDRLQGEARHCGIDTLKPLVQAVQRAVAEGDPKDVVRKALCSLIEQCIQVVGVPGPTAT
jgi:hypothetical protein